jgi:hypothetical protein
MVALKFERSAVAMTYSGASRQGGKQPPPSAADGPLVSIATWRSAPMGKTLSCKSSNLSMKSSIKIHHLRAILTWS